jgi:hypothetical protein
MINLCVLCASAVNPAFPTFGCGVAALCLCGEYSFTVNPEEPFFKVLRVSVCCLEETISAMNLVKYEWRPGEHGC